MKPDNLTNILVAVSPDQQDDRTLKIAWNMAEASGGTLWVGSVIHRNTLSRIGSVAAMGYGISTRGYLAGVATAVAGRVNRFAGAMGADPGSVRPLIRAGDPVAELLGILSTHSMDMLILGAGARGRLERLLDGGVKRHLIRQSPVPVLVHPSGTGVRR